MKKLRRNDEHGFITMIIVLLLILAAAIFFAYTRVKTAQQ
jgi:hypothetical protein